MGKVKKLNILHGDELKIISIRSELKVNTYNNLMKLVKRKLSIEDQEFLLTYLD